MVRARRRGRAAGVAGAPAVAGDDPGAGRRGASCGCWTRCWTARRGVVHAAAAVLFVVNPYVTVYFDAPVDRAAGLRLAAVAAAVRRTAGCASRAAGGGRRRSRWCWRRRAAGSTRRLTGVGAASGRCCWSSTSCGSAACAWRRVGRGRSSCGSVAGRRWWPTCGGWCRCCVAGAARRTSWPSPSSPGRSGATTSLSESLRLMGFWASYVGVGYGGHAAALPGLAPAMLLLLPVVLAGLLTPALALGAFVWTRRWRYAPFFLVLGAGRAGGDDRGVAGGDADATAGDRRLLPRRPVQSCARPTRRGRLIALGLAVLGGAAFARRGRGWRRGAGARRRGGGVAGGSRRGRW